MKKLSQAAFDKAKAFIKSEGRLVDRRLFEYYFENGSAEAVITALADYQNADGGFGHALEPDFRLKESSPMATTVAFQFLHAVKAPGSTEIVKRGIQYFLNTYHDGWVMTSPAVNEVPRAPWWTHDPEKPWGNPDAEIVGYLNQYVELVPPDFLKQVTQRALQELETLKTAMEMHVFLCYVRMAGTVPQALPTLKAMLPKVVLLDPSAWHGYGLRPTGVVNSPIAPLAEPMGDALSKNVDLDIDQQQADGAWHPVWEWGQYEDVWEQAKKDWKGHLTVKNLRLFQNFGRL